MPERLIDLGGAFVAAATPFDSETGDINVAGFRSNLRHWLDAGVRGVLVAGSTGEAVLLSRGERRRLVEAAREEVDGGRLLLAGTGAESTRGTLELTDEAAAAGADAALVQPPAFYREAMSPEALRTHYVTVADRARIPVIVYQVPLRFSTIELETELVSELSRHENVVGIKDSRGRPDMVKAVLDAARPGFQVLVGSGSQLCAALELGATGGILGVANLASAESQAIVSEWRAGRHQEARRIQERVGLLHDSVVSRLGVPGVKVGLDLIGMHGGAPRPPLMPIHPGQRAEVRRSLEDAFITLDSPTPDARTPRRGASAPFRSTDPPG